MLALPRRDRSRCSRRARGRTRGSGGDPRGAGRAWAVHGWNPPGPRPWHRSFLPTASSRRSPRRARLAARGRRGGTGVCGWRPRCTACTRPAERHTVTEQPQTQSQTQGIPIPGNLKPRESRPIPAHAASVCSAHQRDWVKCPTHKGLQLTGLGPEGMAGAVPGEV